MASYLQERELRGCAVKNGAGFLIRTLARLIDLVFYYAAFLFGAFLAGFVLGALMAMGKLQPGWEQRLQGEPLLIALGSVAGNIVYHACCEGIGGVSLGKLVCGLRVIAKSGRPCGMGPAFLRNLGFLFDQFICGVLAYVSMSDSPLRQRFGDKWANTMVVKARDVPEQARRPGWAVPLALCIGGAVSAAIGLAAFLGQVLA